MKTRSTTAAPSFDSDALDAAMKAHPVVLDVIERMTANRKKAEGERDKAVADLAAERSAHRKTKAALEVTQETNEKLFKAIGTTPAKLDTTAAPAAPPVLSDAEALAKWDAWSPMERAAAMMKAATPHRLTMRGDGPMPGSGMFHR